MGSLYLRPNSDITNYMMQGVPSASYTSIDDTTTNDSDYIYTTLGGSSAYMIFGLEDPPAMTNTISKVVMCYRLKAPATSSSYTVNSGCYIEGNLYNGTAYPIWSTSWVDMSRFLYNNPKTGSAWTWDVISSMGIALFLVGDPPDYRTCCSYFYIRVDYVDTTNYFLRKLAKTKQIP